MQKRTFMESAVTLLDLTKFSATVASMIKDEETQEKVEKELKIIYSQVNGSLKAFFKVNEEPWKNSTYDQMTAASRYAAPQKDELRFSTLVTEMHKLKKELEKHSAPVVRHPNGKVWTKTSTDKKRFEKISSSIDSILEIVS